MYLARFADQDTHLLTAAFKWPKPEGPLMTPGWTHALLRQTKHDFALRIEASSSGCNLLLLLNTPAAAETDLRGLCDQLQKTDAPPGVIVPSTAQEFDEVTAGMPLPQLRVTHHGYHHGGRALACDFRLYTMFADYRDAAPTFYQVHLRPHLPDRETERRVRKYMAWLDIERPFSEPVRAMQRMLTGRLLQRGFLAGEYLASQDREDLKNWQDRLRTHFDQTTGKIGFPQAPVETGDFTDLLTIGCYPARGEDVTFELPELAATVFGEAEAALLLSSDLGLGRKEPVAPRRHTDVFISYASSDYAHAAAACRALEENGLACWMAPRDIDRDILPYPEAIQRGISEARAVVVFLSDAANLSVHIPRELDLALERKLAIVPVRLSDIAPIGQLNYLLRTCQWLNAYDRDFHAATEELTGRLRRLF